MCGVLCAITRLLPLDPDWWKQPLWTVMFLNCAFDEHHTTQHTQHTTRRLASNVQHPYTSNNTLFKMIAVSSGRVKSEFDSVRLCCRPQSQRDHYERNRDDCQQQERNHTAWKCGACDRVLWVCDQQHPIPTRDLCARAVRANSKVRRFQTAAIPYGSSLHNEDLLGGSTHNIDIDVWVHVGMGCL